MKRSHFYQQMAVFAISAFIITTAPASAGWLQDAIGDFIDETLVDSKVIGVSLASVGFIWGCLAYMFGWCSLKSPIIAIVFWPLSRLAPAPTRAIAANAPATLSA